MQEQLLIKNTRLGYQRIKGVVRLANKRNISVIIRNVILELDDTIETLNKSWTGETHLTPGEELMLVEKIDTFLSIPLLKECLSQVYADERKRATLN